MFGVLLLEQGKDGLGFRVQGLGFRDREISSSLRAMVHVRAL